MAEEVYDGAIGIDLGMSIESLHPVAIVLFACHQLPCPPARFSRERLWRHDG